MRQRVAFLRTLLAGKPVLLLDEPFASLDAITRAEMQEWLAEALAADPRTVVLVTHDVEEALYLSDRVGGALGPAGARRRRAAPRREPRRPAAPDAVTAPGFRRRASGRWRRCARARGEALAAAAGVVVALLGAWELAARLDVLADVLNLEPFLVPSPSEIAKALWEDRSLLADNAWVTLQEVLLGFALAVAAGVAFAVVLHLSPTLRRAFYPLLVASQTMPIVVIAPILVVWLGFGIGPKLAIIALICFFPITVNTLDGLRLGRPGGVKMMRTLDASRWQTFRRDRGADGPPLLLQRRQDRRRRGGDRRRVRRVGRLQLGPRPPDPAGLGPAADGADVRRGRRALGDRDRCCSRCSRPWSAGSSGGGRTGPEVEQATEEDR